MFAGVLLSVDYFFLKRTCLECLVDCSLAAASRKRELGNGFPVTGGRHVSIVALLTKVFMIFVPSTSQTYTHVYGCQKELMHCGGAKAFAEKRKV